MNLFSFCLIFYNKNSLKLHGLTRILEQSCVFHDQQTHAQNVLELMLGLDLV